MGRADGNCDLMAWQVPNAELCRGIPEGMLWDTCYAWMRIGGDASPWRLAERCDLELGCESVPAPTVQELIADLEPGADPEYEWRLTRVTVSMAPGEDGELNSRWRAQYWDSVRNHFGCHRAREGFGSTMPDALLALWIDVMENGAWMRGEAVGEYGRIREEEKAKKSRGRKRGK